MMLSIRSIRPRQSDASRSSAARAPLERVCLDAHDRLAPDPVLADQFGALQHGDVLLDRRQADRVLAGEGRDREPAVVGAAQDVAARPVGQRAELQVGEPLVVIYNHLVVS